MQQNTPYSENEPTRLSGSFERRHHTSVEGVVTLLDWLLVAFILALVFQAFAIQAFQIPTGSMAETLRGDHYRMRCIRCGHAFDTGSDSMSLDLPQCPNCGKPQPAETIGPLVNGDRIFVLKSIYQFFEPQRWDVVVFKNPVDPSINYIKRLVALPGESIQLIDGDIYIDGQIVRKPPGVQRQLWMPIYVQRYQPSVKAFADDDPTPDRPHWQQPLTNAPGSLWQFDAASPGRFLLNEPDETKHTLIFNGSGPNDFRVVYGYNDSSTFGAMPLSSDLMIRFQVKGSDLHSAVGAVLEKYGVLYAARVDMSGAASFLKYQDDQWQILRRILTDSIGPDRFEAFEFANVDRQLVLRWGEKRFSYDLTGDEDLKSIDRQQTPPEVRLFGSGGLEVRNVGLYRDIYYIDHGVRATPREPFVLGEDEFFVCGDNTPNSLDSRLWTSQGYGNHGVRYQEGIVPREYLMGKAVLIYWSQAFRPRPTMLPVIPNFNNIRTIAGGADQTY